MADFDEASQAFLAWLRHTGAEINPKIKLEDLRHRDAGRGVVAIQDIAEHELLFRIPRSAILSVENSLLSSEIPASTFNALGPWLSLILVMLYENLNGSSSNWSSYFSVLPSEFNTLMFWTKDELAELQASAVVDKIGKESADEMFLEQLVPVIIEISEVFFAGDTRAKQKAEEMRSPANLELMHKMGSLIMAYAFDIESSTPPKNVDEDGYASEEEDEALPKGMVPLADMLNADADQCNARLFYQDRYLDMKALKPIKAGEEVFNDYGPLPRSDLLRRYGYITDNYAQYDVVEIQMDLVADLATAAGIWSTERVEYLDEQEILDSGYDITVSEPFTLQESLSPELIILVETLLLPVEEFDRIKQKGKLPKPEKITGAGAKLLHKIVQTRIAQYATSLEEDSRVLHADSTVGGVTSKSKDRRFAMARAVRSAEKKLLRQAEEALAELTARGGGALKRQRDVDGDVEMGGTGKKQRA
ncbi:SET domain-containing protein [Cucurbitaria berberidis CBS 394.84]|uniref:SET domain-containing protein n=1 Tax=Cucurbitaria berberidis CBS 394.84 TaxID=1168544 RepID=A0A9P4LDX6_9PLEO|nr:SET domain-containing protein [Cucurbitaria berberidis CBS 394.84]KAF1850837.1 SET domain-containing protein [Cucurbitaria berberidis CBS 394.84]